MESPPKLDPEVWRRLDALLSEALTLSGPGVGAAALGGAGKGDAP